MIKQRFYAENIRKFRIDRGLTQEDVALEFRKNSPKFATNTLQNWENKKYYPDADDLVCLANILKQPVENFFRPVSYQSN